MEEIKIKKVTELKDLEIISYLGKQTFRSTFEHETTEEEMEAYLSESFSLEKLQKEFENINSSFFIAYFNNIAVGYAKINLKKKPNILNEFKTSYGDSSEVFLNKNKATENLDDKNLDDFAELQRIYILKDYQGKKIAPYFIYIIYESAFVSSFGSVFRFNIFKYSERS